MQAFFRLGYADARLAAAALSAGTGERVSAGWRWTWRSGTLTGTRRRGRRCGTPSGTGAGEPVALSPARRRRRTSGSLAERADGAAQVEGLVRLSRVSGVDRLYVHAADTKAPVELRALPAGAGPGRLLAGAGRGPVSPGGLLPPPPAVRGVEGDGGGAGAGVDAGADVAAGAAGGAAAGGRAGGGGGGGARCRTRPPPPGFERFLSAAVAGGGQSAREVSEDQEWRREEVERLVRSARLDAEWPDRRRRPGSGADERTRWTGRQARKSPVTRYGAPRHGEGTAPRRSDRPAPALPPAPAGTVAEDGSLA